MPQLIHICTDEKFIEAAKYLFNKTSYDNIFYVVVFDKKNDLNHVKLDKRTVLISENELLELKESLKPNSILLFHSIIKTFYEFIRTSDSQYVLIWIFFGMELYNDKKIYKEKLLFAPLTRKHYIPKQKIKLKKQFKNKIRPYARLFKSDTPYSQSEIKKIVLNKIDYIGIVYKHEFFNILKKFKLKKKEYLFFTYYPLEFIVDVNSSLNENKSYLMIGNSGHPTSNHRDVFEKIKHYNLAFSKIFLPLNYGRSDYINNIINCSNDKLNNEIYPLKDFLKLSEYNKILSKVRVFILYTRRQQGIGNVISLLWYGAKVFLSKRNTFYHYLKRLGVYVYCYETELNQESINKGLSKQEIQYNRAILYKNLNEKYLLNKLETQLNNIVKNQLK